MVPDTSVRSNGRLRRMGRWMLSVVGVVFGATLVGAGLLGASRSADSSLPCGADAKAPTVAAIDVPSPGEVEADLAGDRTSIDEAKRLIAECRTRFAQVTDYCCTFTKRERLECGQQTPRHVLTMKARVAPESFYFKYKSPKAGREAIYIAGRNEGKALVHDVGLGKLLAGTLHLDPKGSMAMEDCRHPITEAGLGHMIDTIIKHWDAELTPGESRVKIAKDASLGDRPCTQIESMHPARRPGFLFHIVRVSIDQELGLPTRFEAYDWPTKPGAAPELVEEYSFEDMKLNVGLCERDFDPQNRSYTFGRF